jgi:hypothetical protein
VLDKMCFFITLLGKVSDLRIQAVNPVALLEGR